jgi:hypothetical protein
MMEHKMVGLVGSWSGDWSGFFQANRLAALTGGQGGQVFLYMETRASSPLLFPVGNVRGDITWIYGGSYIYKNLTNLTTVLRLRSLTPEKTRPIH